MSRAMNSRITTFAGVVACICTAALFTIACVTAAEQPAVDPFVELATLRKMLPIVMQQRDEATKLAQNLHVQIAMLQIDRDALAARVKQLEEKEVPVVKTDSVINK